MRELKRRLDKLTESLGVKEKVLFHLEATKSEGGFIEYAKRLYTDPKADAWVSNQEAHFLYTLMCNLNIAVLDYTAILAPQLWWARIALLQATASCAGAYVANRLKDVNERKGIVAECRFKFVAMMEDACGLREAIAEISDTHFDGQVLFADAASLLEATISDLCEFASEFNDMVKEVEWELIHIDRVPDSCLVVAQGYCDRFVRSAHSESLLRAGDGESALNHLCPEYCFHRLLGQLCPSTAQAV
jgi:hypothetical protein